MNLRLWDDVSVSVVAFRNSAKRKERERERERRKRRFERTEFLRLAPFEIRECFADTRGDFSNKGVPVQVSFARNSRNKG